MALVVSITLAEARERLHEAKKMVVAGKSPAKEKARDKARVKDAETFGAWAEKWLHGLRQRSKLRQRPMIRPRKRAGMTASHSDYTGAPMTNYPEEPAFLDDDGPSDDLSPTTTNARELYGLRPGETVPEAIERKAREG